MVHDAPSTYVPLGSSLMHLQSRGVRQTSGWAVVLGSRGGLRLHNHCHEKRPEHKISQERCFLISEAATTVTLYVLESGQVDAYQGFLAASPSSTDSSAS